MSPSSFKDEESIMINHSDTLVDLIAKMVDFDQHFHLTLMGVAVTDFVSVAEKKTGIQAFLTKQQSSKQSQSKKSVLFGQSLQFLLWFYQITLIIYISIDL